MKNNRNNIVCAFTPYWGNGNPYQDELAKSLEAHGVRVEKGDSLKSVFHNMIFCGYRPDILHLHWVSFFAQLKLITLLRLLAFVTRLYILRIIGVKIIWTVHNLTSHEAQYPKCEILVRRVIVLIAHALIAHTQTAKKEIIARLHVKHPGKIFVVPHGNYVNCYENNADRSLAREKLGIPDSKLVMLFLGGVRPYKGVLQLVEAFKMLTDKSTHLVIAGKPLNNGFRGAIEKVIRGCDNIQFKPGFVAEEEIQVYMNACDIAVFPYQRILTSGAVVLAMSFGRACIAPAMGGVRDTLDASGAFLYDPNCDKSLLGAMMCAVERHADLEHMGQHNRRLAEQWDWNSIAEMTLDVYERSLSRKREQV